MKRYHRHPLAQPRPLRPLPSTLTRALFPFLLALAACTTRCPAPSAAGERQEDAEVLSGSPVSEVEAQEAVEVLPPAAVDEVFDDFLYAYMANVRFQLQRTVFPLPLARERADTTVDAGSWNHHTFFFGSGEYVTIFADKKTAGMAQDTAVNAVTLEYMRMSADTVEQYFFVKDSAGWHLASMAQKSLAHYVNRSFIAFLHRFASDSLFQSTHIRDPFELCIYDADAYEELQGSADASQWEGLKPMLPEGDFYNIDFSQPYARRRHQRIVALGDIAGGEGVVMWFNSRGADDWELTRLEK